MKSRTDAWGLLPGCEQQRPDRLNRVLAPGFLGAHFWIVQANTEMLAQKKHAPILNHLCKRALEQSSLRLVLLARSLLTIHATVDLPESLDCGRLWKSVLATYQGARHGRQKKEEQAKSRCDRETQEESAQVAKYQPAIWPRFRGARVVPLNHLLSHRQYAKYQDLQGSSMRLVVKQNDRLVNEVKFVKGSIYLGRHTTYRSSKDETQHSNCQHISAATICT